jgi:hypothetical protein
MLRKTASRTLAPQGKAIKQMRPNSEASFRKLQDILNSYFNLQEQDKLCEALKIDSPRVPSQTRKTRATNIIQAVVKADRLPELTALIMQLRPFCSGEIAQFNLPDHVTEFSLDFINDTPLPFVKSIQLAEQLANHLDEDTLPDLCFALDIEYENLGGLNHLENVQNLVAIIESRHELDVLQVYLSDKWPSIQWLDEV